MVINNKKRTQHASIQVHRPSFCPRWKKFLPVVMEIWACMDWRTDRLTETRDIFVWYDHDWPVNLGYWLANSYLSAGYCLSIGWPCAGNGLAISWLSTDNGLAISSPGFDMTIVLKYWIVFYLGHDDGLWCGIDAFSLNLLILSSISDTDKSVCF